MKGQWIAPYTGTSEGHLILSIDELDACYEGKAIVMPTDQGLPTVVAYFKSGSKDSTVEMSVDLIPIEKTGFLESNWDFVRTQYPAGFTESKTAHVKIQNVEDEGLLVEATTDAGVFLRSWIPKPWSSPVSKIERQIMSWSDFKARASELQTSKWIYRGQKENWALRTAFHRRNRYAIHRFVANDVRSLHRRLAGVTSHYFDLNIPDQNGAFYNLIQHHGYPTPLLDWSYSPYVAAFFAFRAWPQDHTGNEFARIYLFNAEEWMKRFTQFQNLNAGLLHLSVMEFIPLNNPRVIPQQSVTTITNIDDIEGYILFQEQRASFRFIEAIDIPANQRERAMADLRFMGITAGSMFPGIDGICEEVRELRF